GDMSPFISADDPEENWAPDLEPSSADHPWLFERAFVSMPSQTIPDGSDRKYSDAEYHLTLAWNCLDIDGDDGDLDDFLNGLDEAGFIVDIVAEEVASPPQRGTDPACAAPAGRPAPGMAPLTAPATKQPYPAWYREQLENFRRHR
ncbi:MAG TPA: hypothetical protein VK092_07245, partial [Deinococcales bacterium]|nr:hypothetical protein [Deinococcales bacterium]